jgi:hypothetical protein
MTWHRFLMSLPFDFFMWLWFMTLGWIGMGGKIVKRNVIIATIGAIIWTILANLP